MLSEEEAAARTFTARGVITFERPRTPQLYERLRDEYRKIQSHIIESDEISIFSQIFNLTEEIVVNFATKISLLQILFQSPCDIEPFCF